MGGRPGWWFWPAVGRLGVPGSWRGLGPSSAQARAAPAGLGKSSGLPPGETASFHDSRLAPSAGAAFVSVNIPRLSLGAKLCFVGTVTP